MRAALALPPNRAIDFDCVYFASDACERAQLRERDARGDREGRAILIGLDATDKVALSRRQRRGEA